MTLQSSQNAIALQLCGALHHMHAECRMMHRDLKPQNLIVQSDGSPVVLDFGLALPSADDQAASLRAGKGLEHGRALLALVEQQGVCRSGSPAERRKPGGTRCILDKSFGPIT